MINVDLKKRIIELRGDESTLFCEVGVASGVLHKAMAENNPDIPGFADGCFAEMFKSFTMTDEEVESEFNRIKNERPDIAVIVEDFLKSFELK